MIWNRFTPMAHIQIPNTIINSKCRNEKLFLPLCIFIMVSKNPLNKYSTFYADQFAEFLNIKSLREFNLLLLETINKMEAENLIIVHKKFHRLYIVEPTEVMKDISNGFVKLEIDFIKDIMTCSKDTSKMLTIYPYIKFRMGREKVFYYTYIQLSKDLEIKERIISRVVNKLREFNMVVTKQSCKSYKQRDGSYKWRKVMLIADKTNPAYEKAIACYEQKLNKGQDNADENLW